MQNTLTERLKRFESQSPEIVFEWNDPLSTAKGWVVINSLRGGAAGGGTRMRAGLTMHEVLSLAKTMEVKFSVAGPAIGGAKSGINFDPSHPDKKMVLQRWYKAVYPILKHYYGTGGDLNVDEVHEVIPITESIGLMHPQEGVVRGHFHPEEAQLNKQLNNLRKGVVLAVSDAQYAPLRATPFTISDMATGLGVAASVKAWYAIRNQTLDNKKVLIQGWGNVASAAGWYLTKWGAKLVGILDRECGLIKTDGMGFAETNQLFLEKKGNTLHHPHSIPFKEADRVFWDLTADIFIPAAASRLIQADHLNRMKDAGINVISCGANVPFADQEIFYGPLCQLADKEFTLLPDFIANCGMARCFAYLMQAEASVHEAAIFGDIEHTIQAALETNAGTAYPDYGLYARSISHALSKLGF